MISIIVPNYNHRKFLSQRLETIFNQTFQDFEVILLDDCSTDGSWEYLKQFENHPKVSHCIRNESNSGSPFKQWKKGLDLAKYEWIWIAESDDFCDLEFLSYLISEIEEKVNLIFCKSLYIDESNALIENDVFLKEMDIYSIKAAFKDMKGLLFVSQFLTKRNYILNASSVIFKKPALFPEKILNMKFTGDWYFWIYLIKENKIKYLNKPLNYFRFHPGTTRNFLGDDFELKRSQEIIDTISFALKVSKRYFPNYYDSHNFEIIRDYFIYQFKLGRLRLEAIFPSISIFFYPLYMLFYFKSFFSKKI